LSTYPTLQRNCHFLYLKVTHRPTECIQVKKLRFSRPSFTRLPPRNPERFVLLMFPDGPLLIFRANYYPAPLSIPRQAKRLSSVLPLALCPFFFPHDFVPSLTRTPQPPDLHLLVLPHKTFFCLRRSRQSFPTSSRTVTWSQLVIGPRLLILGHGF